MPLEPAVAEQELRGRMFRLAREGNPVPDDLIASLRDARAARFEHLRRLRPDEALEELAREVSLLETRLRVLEEGGRSNGGEAILESLDVGESLRWTLWLSEALSREAPCDPLALVEEEIAWVERSARDLDRIARPRGQAAGGLLAGVRAARSRLLRERLSRLLDAEPAQFGGGPAEAAEAAWRAACEAFRIEGDLARERAGQLEPGAGQDLAALRSKRERCEEAARTALQRSGRAEAGRFLRRAAAEILDAASAVLSESAARAPDRLPSLRSLRDRMDAFQRIAAETIKALPPRSPGGDGVSGAPRDITEDERAEVQEDLRRVARDRRRLRTAEREAEVRTRLERSFGARAVSRFESLLLVLIVAFIAVIAAEWGLDQGSPWLPWVHGADIVLCSIFQLDFFVRWAHARWRGGYFLRHFFLESLPAVPYAFLFETLRGVSLGGLDEVRALLALRILGVERVVVTLTRLFRVTVFLVQGSDRAVEKFRRILDRDVVFFEPHPLKDAPESPVRSRLLGLADRRRKLARHLFSEMRWEDRPALLERCLCCIDAESRSRAGLTLPYAPALAAPAGEARLERVIAAFLECDASSAMAYLGSEGTERMARWLRFIDTPVTRSMPFLRDLAPAARQRNAADAVAAAAQGVGEKLQRLLAAFRFWGDLSGITTGPQVLDRIATAVIAATFRPATRLLLFGGLFLLFTVFAYILDVVFLEKIANGLWLVLGGPLLTLGAICLVIFLAGRWLKRIAGEALDVYLRTADAHFYPLLKDWKLSRRGEDMRTIYRRVFLPEARLRGGEPAPEADWLRFIGEAILHENPDCEGDSGDSRFLPFCHDRRQVALMYRDFLDGPILHRSDDRTSVQLLGNLVVQDLRRQTLGMSKKDLRRLERLDLEKRRLLGLGPYFWFRFMTESLAIETAKLLMEYSTSCIPLELLPFASPERRQRFNAFLESRREGLEPRAARRAARGARHSPAAPLVTSELTALNFLTADPVRDEVVRSRFGSAVLEALRRDRKAMVRDIFGTRPYHVLPKSQRSFNPYRLYRRYLGGAKVFLLPFFVALGCARVALTLFSDIARLVRDVLGKEGPQRVTASRLAGFDVAVRKINRMRKPYFMEALKLRAVIDIEYTGLRLPGCEKDDECPTFRRDLDFIGAPESERRPLEVVRTAQLRDLRRFRVFLGQKGWLGGGLGGLLRLLDPSGALACRQGEVIRALATAYVTDHGSLRSIITAGPAAREFFGTAVEAKDRLRDRIRSLWIRLTAGVRPAIRRRRRIFREYAGATGELRHLSPRLSAKALLAFLRAPGEWERVLVLAAQGAGDSIFEVLRSVAADHAVWTQKIVLIRALQAITVMEIESYRDLIWAVGGYGEEEGRVRQPPGEVA